MAGFGVREANIERERRPRINLCGSCGKAISDTELLCVKCRADESVYNVHTYEGAPRFTNEQGDRVPEY